MSEDKQRRKKKGERKDGRVQVTLTTGMDERGRPIRKSFFGRSRAEACRKRDEYKVKMAIGIVDNRVTVGEWVDTCLRLYRQNVDPAYINNDAVPYKRLKKDLGRMMVADVREADLQASLNKMEGMSISSIEKYFYALNLVFGKARANKIIPDNPAEGLTIPRGTKGTHRILERWEIACVMDNWQRHRCGLWAMLMLLCGLRRSEMMGLRWDNVDLEHRKITVCEVAVISSNQTKLANRAKSPAGLRVLPICRPLLLALESVPEEKRVGHVCQSASGDRMTQSAFDSGWKSYCYTMELLANGEEPQPGSHETKEERRLRIESDKKKYITFSVLAHDLRHTFATALYDAGVPVKAAQYYLGHSDIRMTLDLYTHLSTEREKASRSQMVNFLDNWLIEGNEGSVEGIEKTLFLP